MKSGKKMLATALCLIMLFGSVALGGEGFSQAIDSMIVKASAEAETSGTCGDNLTWSYNTGTQTLTISGTGDMYNYNDSNAPWNDFKESIKTVEISNGATSIGSSAFFGCTGLTSETIPNSVKSIGDCAFKDCSGLTSVTIPNSVTSIGNEAFINCSSLSNIKMSDNITVLGVNAFKGTTFFENKSNWENGVLYLGKCLVYAKFGEVSGDYVIKPGTVCIAFGAFSPVVQDIDITDIMSLTGITSVTIPESIKGIGFGAFAGCPSLKTVYYNAENISESSSFYNNSVDEPIMPPFYASAVENVYIGENVKKLPDYLFSYCPFLKKVYFPDTIISISDKLLYRGTGLAMADSEYYYYINQLYMNNGESSFLESVPAMYVNEGSYAYTFAVANSLNYALYDDTGAEFMIKNGALTAFEGSTQNIVIPSGVSLIGSGAFKDNKALKNIEIPYSVSVVGAEAFSDCTGLESVIIPFTVTKIGKDAFKGSNAKINCYYNSYAYNYAVENNIPYEIITVSFAQDTVSVKPLSNTRVNASPSVALASGLPMVFKSADPSIATVDGEGTVKGVSEGSTEIEVYTETNNYLGKCTVNVTDDAPPCEHGDKNGDGKCDNCGETMTYTKEITVDGKTVGKVTYRYGDTKLENLPEVPAKEGYEGEWDYTIEGSLLNISAKYTPVTYYATFVADGKEVAKLPFTVKNKSLKEPAVPAKEGYTGKWSEYTLGASDITIQAVYTKIDNPEPPTPTYKLPTSFNEQTAAYNTMVTVNVKLNNIPEGAKVYINGKEATVNGNIYSAEIGQASSTKTVNIEVRQGTKVLDSSTLTVKVDTGFFSKLVSFFSNFLFNMLKWKKVTVNF